MSSESSTWSLTVRMSNGERMMVSVPSSASVKQCKEQIQASKAELEVARQRLVYKGRILDDGDRLLTDYGVVDQSTLFLVMSSATATTNRSNTAAATTTTPSTSSAPASSSTTSTNPMPSVGNPWGAPPSSSTGTGGSYPPPPFDMLGMGSNNPPNPQQISQMMNSPMMQNLMDNNPEFLQQAMQQALQSNPQLQRAMEQNPELRHVMEDPQAMQQALQMMRNPEMMQQAMRQQELAMSQLENLPGGFSALSSMYRNIQEPLMDAHDNAPSDTGSTPRNSSNSNEGATGAAMPNPWGTPTQIPTSTATSSTSSNAAAGANNPWGAVGGMSPSAPNPWGGAGAGGMPPPPQNMEQMMQLLENPMVANMMQTMVDQNPDMIRTMLEQQHPMLRQMFQNNPEAANQFVRQMMNPQTMRSMMQMQQAMGGGAGMPMPSPPPAGGLDFSNLLGGLGGAPPAMDFGSLMQSLQGMQPPPQGTAMSQQQHPADRFRVQLQSLRDMGFDDEQASLAALQANHGNLNRAVDQLLMGPPAAAPPAAPPAAVPPPASSSSPPEQSDAEPKNQDDKKND